jgi:alkylation response protein AidB-like acyl-CoA dehydrogenase
MESATVDTGLDFGYTENQLMIRDMIRKFGDEHIRPKMMEWDESQEFPVEVFKKLGELGLMGVLIPESYGGSGFGYNEYVTTLIEIGKITIPFAAVIFCSLETKNKRKNTFPGWLPQSGSEPGV